jgi:hypothetical protein
MLGRGPAAIRCQVSPDIYQLLPEGRVMMHLDELMATLLLAALVIAGLIAWGVWL